MSNVCATNKDPESDGLAPDNLETNPITIKSGTASHVADQFSWVPLPCWSPPGRPFPVKSQYMCLLGHSQVLERTHSRALEEVPLPAIALQTETHRSGSSLSHFRGKWDWERGRGLSDSHGEQVSNLDPSQGGSQHHWQAFAAFTGRARTKVRRKAFLSGAKYKGWELGTKNLSSQIHDILMQYF